jgi:NifU-like protein involved in Fe-S cluster formation
VNHPADTVTPSDSLAEFRAYAASVRRDRRLSGSDVRTLTLKSQLESQDSVTLDARIEHGVVTELGYRIRACSLAQAVTGILVARTPGITASQLLTARQALERVLQDKPPEQSTLIWPELLALQSAAGMPDRHEVALLPFYVLQQLLAAEEE